MLIVISRRTQIFYEVGLYRAGVSKFALPDDDNIPTQRFERLDVTGVSSSIRFNLRTPELDIGLRRHSDAATMTVPVATVNKYDLPTSGKNYVWFSR